MKQHKALPDAAAIRWELERLARDEEGQRMFQPRVELTGADGGPVEIEEVTPEEHARRMMAELDEMDIYVQGVEDGREREAERAEAE